MFELAADGLHLGKFGAFSEILDELPGLTFHSSEGKVLSQNDGQGEHREGKEYDQYDLGQRVRGEHQTPQIAGEAIWQRLQ